jgi:molybdopterin/thiamine biosynthesis adenylyltransferase
MSREAFIEIDSSSPTEAGSAAAPRPSRGARLPRLIAGPADIDAVLRGLKIGMIGVGSVGRVAAVHFARLQIGTLWLVDQGIYKPESLLTQPIAPSEAGRAKASSTGRVCKAISPETRVLACDGPIQNLDLAALQEADLVLLATDNLAAEADTAQRCLRLGRPLVQASVHGDTMTAQVRTFAHRDGSGPCPVCGFGRAEWAHMHRETRFSCEGAATAPSAPLTAVAATMSFSFLCSLAADLAVAQVVRLVLGLGTGVEDTLLEYCAYRHRAVVSPLSRNPDCPVDHTAFRPFLASAPLAECTLRRLALEADSTLPTAEGGLVYCVGGADFVEVAVCGCSRFHPVHKFLQEGADLGMCAGCGLARRPLPFHTHRWVSSASIEPLLDTPLAELGVPPPEWVVVRSRTEAFLVRGRGNGSGNPSQSTRLTAEKGAKDASV